MTVTHGTSQFKPGHPEIIEVNPLPRSDYWKQVKLAKRLTKKCPRSSTGGAARYERDGCRFDFYRGCQKKNTFIVDI